MQAIGDLARGMLLRSQQARMQAELDVLGKELTTGRAHDPASHLRGDVGPLLSISRSLDLIAVHKQNQAEMAMVLTGTQTALGAMQSRTEALLTNLTKVPLTPLNADLDKLSGEARAALQGTVVDLNTSVAGQYLLSGTATQEPPLAAAEVILDEIVAAVGGLDQAADISAALASIFDQGGLFDTVFYRGSAESRAPVAISEGESSALPLRADDDTLRAALKSLSMAAIASDERLALSDATKSELLSKAHAGLLSSHTDLVGLRAGVGAEEARLEEVSVQTAARRTSLHIAQEALVGVDEYETAARFENIRGQLETLYALTARSQQLSLSRFL